MTALDSSVVIAAFAPWHEAHSVALRAVSPDAVVPAHVVTETYAVLTRMPEPFRMDASTVAAYLTRQWGGRVIAPDAALYESKRRGRGQWQMAALDESSAKGRRSA